MDLTKTDRLMVTLSRQIVSGKYLPGAALPAEANSCEELATSRNIIREVFYSLEVGCLIEVKYYRGVFVTPRSQWNSLNNDILRQALEQDEDPGLIAAMSEVYNLVEPAVVHQAAKRAISSGLAQIEAALSDMIANNQQYDASNEVDTRHHGAASASVYNPALQQFSVVVSSLQHMMFERTRMEDEANMPQTLREHKALFDAVRYQDSNAAEHAALTMIASPTQRLKEIT